MKPDGDINIRRARDEARKSGPTSYYPFRITGQGVRTDGEVNWINQATEGKPTSQQHASVRDEVGSPEVIGERPEAS